MTAYAKMTKAKLIETLEALEAKNLELSSDLVAAQELAEQRRVLLDAANARIEKAVETFRSQQAQIRELSAKRQAPKSTWQPGTVASTYVKAGESWQKVRGEQPGRFSHRKVEAA